MPFASIDGKLGFLKVQNGGGGGGGGVHGGDPSGPRPISITILSITKLGIYCAVSFFGGY